MPRKAVDSAVRLRSLNLKTTESLRSQLEDAARRSGRALTYEVEYRLGRSFDDDDLQGIGTRFIHAARKVTALIIRVSRNMPESMRGSPLNHEVNTRREWHAAVEVLKHAYAPTEVERPDDPVAKMLARPWGAGDRGRLYAYNWLEFEGDDLDALNEAKSARIDDWWTGDGSKVLGDLVDAGLLTREQADKRLNLEGEPHPLADIMAERDGIRPENAEERAAGWQAMLARERTTDDADDAPQLSLDAPAGKPKRGRKAKT